MTYSVDFRKKVVAFVHSGGGQAERHAILTQPMVCS
jgi:hypothetical protein